MPRIVITHAVQDVDRWLGGNSERAAALPGAIEVTDLVALTTPEALKSLLSSMPPEVAAQAESHGVIMPMTIYVEA